jgi:hypothetical protein
MLLGDDVALKIEADVHRFSVPHSGAAPEALVVLFQAANIAEALRLDPRLGLTFGEAVSAGDRRPRRWRADFVPARHSSQGRGRSPQRMLCALSLPSLSSRGDNAQ